MPPSADRAFFLAPSWLLLDDSERIELFDFPGGGAVELRGLLRESVLRGEATAALRTMAVAEPALGRLIESLRGEEPRPLDRATLLRGAGFEQLFVELTAQCNEQCTHCYAESSPRRTEALDEPTVRAVLEDASELGFGLVQLTGGDPLVSPLCVPAARYAHELGIPGVEIYTNGLALHGSLYDRLTATPVSFAFSFYSHDADRHDAITCTPGSQRRTAAAIERTVADGHPVRVSIIVMDVNADDAEDTFAFIEGLGVEAGSIHVDVQRSVGRGLMTIRPNEATWPNRGGTHRQQSSQLGGRAAVSYDGVVFPCIFTRAFALGSVHEERLSEILLADRALHVDRSTLLGACAAREEQLSCWDCRLRASLLTPSP